MTCWPKGLTSRGRSASARRHNNDATELEVKTVAQPSWAPPASESTGKEESYGAGWGIDPDLKGKLDSDSTVGAGKGTSGTQEIP